VLIEDGCRGVAMKTTDIPDALAAMRQAGVTVKIGI
jgi:4-hydroxyphenylpyruvate dioxygenase-like putative hemolysin